MAKNELHAAWIEVVQKHGLTEAEIVMVTVETWSGVLTRMMHKCIEVERNDDAVDVLKDIR